MVSFRTITPSFTAVSPSSIVPITPDSVSEYDPGDTNLFTIVPPVGTFIYLPTRPSAVSYCVNTLAVPVEEYADNAIFDNKIEDAFILFVKLPVELE